MVIKINDTASLAEGGEFRRVVQIGEIKGRPSVWIDDGDGGSMSYPVAMLYAVRLKGKGEPIRLRPDAVATEELPDNFY